jgi:hypothetical protein
MSLLNIFDLILLNTLQDSYTVIPRPYVPVRVINRKGAGRGTKNVTPNVNGVTKNNSNLPDNLRGPVQPYRMISLE